MAFIAQNNEDDPTVQNVSTNLFQQTTGGGQPIQSGAMSPTGQGGDQSQSIQGGPQNTQRAPAISNAASSSKEIVRRNEGKAQSPYDLGAMSANIKNAKTGLQAEADNYTKAQREADYSVPGDQINKALAGDKDAYSSVGTRLTQAKPGPAAFSPTTTTDYSPKVNQLEDASLKNYFKNAGGPMATAGESAFDTMLLNKNKQFKQERDAVKNEAYGLNTEAKAIKDKAAADAAVGYNTAYDTGTQKIKGDIGNAINPIRDKAAQQAAAAEAERQRYAGMTSQDQIKNTPGYEAWLRNIVGEIGGDTGQQNYLNEMVTGGLGRGQVNTDEMSLAGRVGINPNFDFIDASQAPVSANNFLDADQAQRLNSGNDLLGQGGTRYAAGGAAASPYSFNSGAAKAFLSSLIGKKFDADADAKAQQASFDKNSREVDARYAAAAAKAAQDKAEADAREEARNRRTNLETGTDIMGGGIARGSAEEGKKLGESITDEVGTVICTEYFRQGWISQEIYDACQAYGKKVLPLETKKNYLAWAVHVVPVLQAYPILCYVLWPLFYNWFFYMAHKMGAHKKKPVFGHLIFKVLCPPLSNAVGSTIRRSRKRHLEACSW